MTGNIQAQLRKVIQKINEQNPYYLLWLVLAFLLIGLYLFPIQFQLSSLQVLGPRVRDLGQDLENSKNNIQRLPQYQKENAALQRRMVEVTKKVKPLEELPVLLENISRIAGKNNVRIEQVMPQSAAQKPVLENNDGKYFAIPIMVEAKSGYHDLGRFINQLETEGIFAQISDFVITSEVNHPAQQSARLTLKSILLEKKGKGDEPAKK